MHKINYKSLSKVLRYSDTNDEDSFHKALDENPDDHTTRLVLADYLQEHNDPRAEGYRALARLGLVPLNVRHGVTEDGYTHDGNKSNHDTSKLPMDWFKLVDRSKSAYPNYWTHQPPFTPDSVPHTSRRKVEDAAAIAFSKLPEERRKELLEGKK